MRYCSLFITKIASQVIDKEGTHSKITKITPNWVKKFISTALVIQVTDKALGHPISNQNKDGLGSKKVSPLGSF